MSAAARFKQADLTRAVRGCEKGGVRVASVEIDGSGKIVIHADRGQVRKGQGWEDLE